MSTRKAYIFDNEKNAQAAISEAVSKLDPEEMTCKSTIVGGNGTEDQIYFHGAKRPVAIISSQSQEDNKTKVTLDLKFKKFATDIENPFIDSCIKWNGKRQNQLAR